MERRIVWVQETVAGKLTTTNDVLITGVSTDTRTLEVGNLYVPLQGEQFDGHHFLSRAIDAGAKAALWQADRDVPQTDIPLIIVPDTLIALQQLAKRYLAEVGCKVVAITGSNGKTTTKDLVASVLATTFAVHKTDGNFNNHIGLPLTVLQMPASTEIAVLEMGMNHLGEISVLSQLAKPDVAMVTNIGESHIGYLGSREKIAEAKLEICDGLAANGMLLIDGDEPLLQVAKEVQTTSIGWDAACDEGPESIEMHGLDGWSFTSRKTGSRFMVPLLGKHNIKNALFAVETGRLLGVSETNIAKGLEEVPMTPLRLQLLTAKNGMQVIDDSYNASPTSVYAALELLLATDANVKWAVLAGIEELGAEEQAYHEQIGSFAADLGISLITVGEKGRWIYEGAQQRNQQGEQMHFATRAEAYAYLLDVGDKDTIILVKASRKAGLDYLVKQLVEGA
jgi:UDP-N-acetylmuramoyl-tripeptide--D-alanyl-D-alanine ligase